MTLRETLITAQALPLDRLDAQLLLLHVLGRPAHDRAWLLAHDDDALSNEARLAFDDLATRRAAGEPLAYLTGFKSFYSLELAVTPAVLIPRPDTETLVDWALALLQSAIAARAGLGAATELMLQVLDLGTGSGAIALALKHSYPQAAVTATDSSLAALEIARANAARLQLVIDFIHCDWLLGLRNEGEKGDPSGKPPSFHLIVSNPPYIVEGDAHLPALGHEPISALTAGHDGLADIRQIITQAPAHLCPGGWLLLEHGYDQAAAVRELLTQAGFAQVQSRRDLNGIERCSGGQSLGDDSVKPRSP